MPLKLSLYRPRVKANDIIAKQRIGESERIKVNHLIQSLDIVFITVMTILMKRMHVLLTLKV